MHDMKQRLGIEFISVLGLPPVAFVALADELDCRNISLAIAPLTENPRGYPAWSFRDDPALRRDTVAALRNHGVSVSLGEGFLCRPGVGLAQSGPDLDIMCELGARRVNVLSLDDDPARALDELGAFAALAAARGLETMLEFIPGMPIGDLAAAIAAIRHVGRRDFRLLVDVMHVFRSGATVAELATLDPADVGYIQLCDVPLASTFDDYAYEALHERLAPGQGELPLHEALAVLPRDVPVGLEVPKLTLAKGGATPKEWLAVAIRAARALLNDPPEAERHAGRAQGRG